MSSPDAPYRKRGGDVQLMQRHQRQQARARLDVVAWLLMAVSDHAVNGCDDDAMTLILSCEIERRAGVRSCRSRLVQCRVEDRALGPRHCFRFLRHIEQGGGPFDFLWRSIRCSAIYVHFSPGEKAPGHEVS